MSGTDRHLERECTLFTRYLTGARPTPYVVDRYRTLHAKLPELRRPATAIERTLLALGRLPVTLRIADAYARLFDRAGPLRRKLVLLLAILEMSPPLAGRIEAVDPVSRPLLLLRLAGRAAGSVACALAGTALLLPLHLVFGLTGGVVRTWQR